MGRTRGFDEACVVRQANDAFLATGYEATSVDDLVRATGLQRGSLYQAFGSKRGIFLAALRQVTVDPRAPSTLDLLLIAALEMAPRDDEIRRLVAEAVVGLDDPAQVLGDRLLQRAHLQPVKR